MKKKEQAAGREPDDEAAGVRAWLAGVDPGQRALVKRIDAIIAEEIPGVRRTIKWRKPSQPLGIPFYGLPSQGWIAAMWSFKGKVGVGFFAGTLLDPEPPVDKMAGPWNRGSVKARRLDISDQSELDEALLRSWLIQARKLPGWGHVEDNGD